MDRLSAIGFSRRGLSQLGFLWPIVINEHSVPAIAMKLGRGVNLLAFFDVLIAHTDVAAQPVVNDEELNKERGNKVQDHGDYPHQKSTSFVGLPQGPSLVAR